VDASRQDLQFKTYTNYIYASAVRPAFFDLEKSKDVFRFGAALPDIIILRAMRCFRFRCGSISGQSDEISEMR
jgi:hypothetical protein